MALLAHSNPNHDHLSLPLIRVCTVRTCIQAPPTRLLQVLVLNTPEALSLIHSETLLAITRASLAGYRLVIGQVGLWAELVTGRHKGLIVQEEEMRQALSTLIL